MSESLILTDQPDRMIYDLITGRLQFFKRERCLLDCSVQEFLSNPHWWTLLPENQRLWLTRDIVS